MVEDLLIRMYIRFPGDPPPDLAEFSDPVTIPAWVTWRDNDEFVASNQDGHQGIPAQRDGSGGGYSVQLAQARMQQPAQREMPRPPRPAPPPPQSEQLTYAQIAALVAANNRSRQPDELIIAIIYQESTFYPDRRNPHTSAAGLMGVTRGAMADVVRRVPHLASADVMDPATNVQMGSRYLQLRLDTVYQGDVRRALAQYGEGLAYADGVIAARDALAGAPSIDTLRKRIRP